ncbi:hypothetical protein [Tenacibaculum soleae]|uniref:hypothetical protein n=1 Tax=Tenacibaculum soleae TaxID=447689 RepID=UPI0023011671|nr:hypothetical protein [Tenacibaculum soleae]
MEYNKKPAPLKVISSKENLSFEEKEDEGLLFLMRQADKNDVVAEEEIFSLLHQN